MTQTNSNDSVALLNSSHIRMKQQINTGLINGIISFWLGSDPLGAIRWANVHRSSTLTLFDLNRTSLISFNGNICVYFTISGQNGCCAKDLYFPRSTCVSLSHPFLHGVLDLGCLFFLCPHSLPSHSIRRKPLYLSLLLSPGIHIVCGCVCTDGCILGQHENSVYYYRSFF